MRKDAITFADFNRWRAGGVAPTIHRVVMTSYVWPGLGAEHEVCALRFYRGRVETPDGIAANTADMLGLYMRLLRGDTGLLPSIRGREGARHDRWYPYITTRGRTYSDHSESFIIGNGYPVIRIGCRLYIVHEIAALARQAGWTRCRVKYAA